MQAAPPLPPQQKLKGRSIQFLLDKSYYLPGQKVQGNVQVNLEHDTSFRSLSISLRGVEETRVVVRHGKSSSTYKSSRDMLNVGVQLLGQATVEAGSTLYPFAFDLPPDALPSYSGKNVHVTWKLSARADIPWHGDLNMELFLPVYNTPTIQSAPVAAENPEPAPKIVLSLSSNLYQPGETIEGKVILAEPKNLRSVKLQVMIDEQASAAHGTWTGGPKTESGTVPIVVAELAPAKLEDFTTGDVLIRFPLSTNAPCTYNGPNSSLDWYLYATLDIPHASDFHLSLPFTVGLRSAPQTVQMPQAVTTTPATPALLQPLAGPAWEGPLPDSFVLEILADGSPMDLVSISNQLQQKIGFLDINQVRYSCEKLVQEGKLERTGEGEFLAQYSMKW